MDGELFEKAEIVSVAPDYVVPNAWPYFIVACWPRGAGYWKIHENMWSALDSPTLLAEIERMRKAGWRYVTVCKLPDLPGGKA